MRFPKYVYPGLLLIVTAFWLGQGPISFSSIAVQAENHTTPARTIPSASQIQTRFANLPLAFERNQGQFDTRLRYVARSKNFIIGLTESEVVAALPGAGPEGSENPPAVVRMRFQGGSSVSTVTAENPLLGTVNYLVGNQPSDWQRNVPTFGTVRLKNLYPGVDLLAHGTGKQFKYDLELQPGSEPKRISLVLEGVESAALEASGDVVLRVPGGEIRHHKPVIYQEVNGQRRTIAGRYLLKSAPRAGAAVELGFEIGAFETSVPLVIDPVISYSTYLGGLGSDMGMSVTVDNQGNAYLTGETFSGNFPTVTPFFGTIRGISDCFVAKLNLSGNALVYSTYLGGNSLDSGAGVAVDGTGSVFVTGRTSSVNFPTSPGGFQAALGGNTDAFVTKLAPAGNSLVFSTYVGGLMFDAASSIALDPAGNACLTGQTSSTNFPVQSPVQAASGGVQDAFVTKINADGTGLVFSTYLGGSAEENTVPGSITLDTAGNIYLAGTTNSTNFPTVNPIQAANAGQSDLYVAKFNAAGSALLYATYLGGQFNDLGQSISVDASGNAYVTGSSASPNFPVVAATQATNRGGSDAVVLKINPAGTALVFSTYWGGTGDDFGQSGFVTDTGGLFFVGQTASGDFPVLNATSSFSGGTDAFVAQFNPSGVPAFSTYLGGTGAEGANGIFVDPSDAMYIIGQTSSTDFTTVGGVQNTNNGANDVFVVKMRVNPLPAATFTQFYPVASTSGKPITITGNGFFPGGVQVFFGGSRLIPASAVQVVSLTQVRATVPPSSSGSGNVNGFITVRVLGSADLTSQGFPSNAPNPGDPAAVFPEFIVWGDTTGDGTFQTNDVSLARAFLLFQATPTTRQTLAVDVVPANANGSRGNGQLASADFSFLRAVSFGQTTF
ncbi:MAG: SBBP repeat-containing protein [Blastocatellia bacterium]|nr:SBBP repeat-containing protein [Blastocatellia bacterium]